MEITTIMKWAMIFLVTIISPAAYSASHIDPLTSEVTANRPDAGVEPSPQEDKIITESVKSQIKKSPSLSKLHIDVKTERGLVTLSGNVDSDSQASTLIELAQSVIGTKDVEASNLKVKESTEPYADMMTTARIRGLFIREEIFGTKDIASINLGVETRNGVVYLTGTVDNQQQIENAIKLIQTVPGIKKVEYSIKKVVPTSGYSKRENEKPVKTE